MNEQQLPDCKPLVTKTELAAMLRCSVRTISNLMRRKTLPFTKVGRLTRFNPADCLRALEAGRIQPRPQHLPNGGLS